MKTYRQYIYVSNRGEYMWIHYSKSESEEFLAHISTFWCVMWRGLGDAAVLLPGFAAKKQ